MSIATEAVLDETRLLGDIVHLVCCEDEDLGLCNADLKGHRWAPAIISCTGCIVNDSRGLCPLTKSTCTWGSNRYGDNEDGD